MSKTIGKWISLAVFILVITSVAYLYLQHTPGNHTQAPAGIQSAAIYNAGQIDSSVALLRSGDLVVRTGNDGTSYLLSQMNKKDKTYSHCGIVMVENGYPFVYHSIGGEDNPDEKLRRDSANFWFSPAHNLGYAVVRYDLSAENIQVLNEVVQKYYREEKKFDMDFDLESDDRFYCAEFVYRSLTRAMNDPLFIQPTLLSGKKFVGVDDLFLTPHASMICQIRFK